MRVLCIDASNPLMPEQFLPWEYVVEGEVYTVTDDRCGIDDVRYYNLAEFTRVPTMVYRSTRFVVLSDTPPDMEENTEARKHDVHAIAD